VACVYTCLQRDGYADFALCCVRLPTAVAYGDGKRNDYVRLLCIAMAGKGYIPDNWISLYAYMCNAKGRDQIAWQGTECKTERLAA